MSTGFEFNVQVRNTTGKAEARRMRRSGFVPGVIYGADKEPTMITLEHDAIMHALNKEAFHTHILDVKLDDGKTETVVLKAVQRHVFKPKVEHVDFLRVKANEKLTMRIPLHYLGEEECVGVKEGGVISKLMTDVEIKCLPANLPQFIEVDITGLALDHSLHLTDVKLPSGVEFAHDVDESHDQPIISIALPKVSKADEAADAAEAEASSVEGAAEGDKAAGDAEAKADD
ncbi:MAG: 50S ribosomal protein L25/general stress protein Ctc [Robiginitomaculum sp.]|nr:50S ribosomal protein L25/general stress protein Ctc [Robiginitomaculum sp.]